MVEDLYFLSNLQKLELPLYINKEWHPKIRNIYNEMLSGNRAISNTVRIPRTGYETDFFVYELEPIDDWEGYPHVFLEDLLEERKWLNLIHHTLKILKENSNWEQDVISGPYISALPGMELTFSHWVVLLKQDNNGTTYAVSRYNLDYLSDFLIACNVIENIKKVR
jgi:hypothetical protein